MSSFKHTTELFLQRLQRQALSNLRSGWEGWVTAEAMKLENWLQSPEGFQALAFLHTTGRHLMVANNVSVSTTGKNARLVFSGYGFVAHYNQYDEVKPVPTSRDVVLAITGPEGIGALPHQEVQEASTPGYVVNVIVTALDELIESVIKEAEVQAKGSEQMEA